MSVVIDASIGDIIKVTEPGFNGGVLLLVQILLSVI